MKKYIIYTICLFLLFAVKSKAQEFGYKPDKIHPVNMIMEALLEKNVTDEELFKTWVFMFKKEYNSITEEKQRFRNFQETVIEVKAHNANKQNTFRMGLNKFADMTYSEWIKTYFFDLNEQKEKLSENMKDEWSVTGFRNFDITGPDSNPSIQLIDWSSKTGDVYDQQSCGSCYAHAAVNAIESNYYIKNGGTILKLARQQIVDCSPLTGGCDGGFPQYVFFYAFKKGLMLEKDYPYTATVGTCQYNSNKAVKGLLKGVIAPKYSSIGLENFNNLYESLKNGPVAVTYNASIHKNYSGGIVDTANCTSVNHAVLMVGLGYDSVTSRYYYIIKNSWGTWWGESGFFRAYVNNTGPVFSCFLESYPNLSLA